jgi:AcrR family transcriptional regulator
VATTPQLRRLAAEAADLPEGARPGGTPGRILDAALSRFAEYGFYGASIRDIAASAGVRSATLYAHYPSKEHLLADLARIGHEVHQQRLQAAVLDAGDDPAAQMAALVKAHVRSNAEFPLLAVVSNELHALSPELAAAILAIRNGTEELVQAVILRGIRQGTFHVADPLLAEAAIGSMGLRVAFWFRPDSGRTIDDVADAYAEFALRILGAGAPR